MQVIYKKKPRYIREDSILQELFNERPSSRISLRQPHYLQESDGRSNRSVDLGQKYRLP